MIQSSVSSKTKRATEKFASENGRRSAEVIPCFHCGTRCGTNPPTNGDKSFCCQGCLTVFELLAENGLTDFYKLSETAGVRINASARADRFKFLDEPAVRERLVDFADAQQTKVTFHIPAIHCIACVWLLENLFRLKPGIGQSRVNFPRKEISLSFTTGQVKLSEAVTLLASLGYEPELKLSALESKSHSRTARRLWIQLGLAGFAFGNIMLFSISAYLGLDAFTGPGFRKLVGVISFLLATPVVIYSALDYWKAAWRSLEQKLLNIDVPIAAGVLAIYIQSTYEVFTGRGDGYFDSLCGLIFFLLCGRLFQQKTYDRLAFDRDYKSFFPLSVTRKSGRNEEAVSLAQLQVGDRLLIRNGELIPADSKLIHGPALVDYSFVTGESEPVEKKAGDHLYAGGRQMGGAIEAEMVKAVSQSYLTSLWNQDAFRKERRDALNQITNTYSQRFTKIVIAIAVMAALFWAFVNPQLALKSFTSVLIVACPCALALAAPFALGTAQRILARRNVFLKNPYVLETLAKVDSVVFDKTGTLTSAGAGSVAWHGNGQSLSDKEERWIFSMTRHSTHPLAVRIGEAIARNHFPETVRSFLETPGCGMEASVDGHEIWVGAATWLESRGASGATSTPDDYTASTSTLDGLNPPGDTVVNQPASHTPLLNGSTVHVAIDGKYRGCFVLTSALRPETERLVSGLLSGCEVALLSGDNDKDRPRFEAMFGPAAQLLFQQTPFDKLNFIKHRQAAGRTVMMAGDGLNDAGALKQADVGVAVVENVSAFSPASDVIMAAGMIPRTGDVLAYSKLSVRVVRAAFLISAFYNLGGVAIAASGKLSPVVCAILMPLSSISVVGFACGAAAWLGRGIGGKTPARKVGVQAIHVESEI